MELISIITPTHNSTNTIVQTIESILSQTYENWELIICDDGSIDDTIDKILLYNDDRIKLYKNKISYGASEARNTSLKNSIGDYICFLDSDDIWSKDKLLFQLSFMKENNLLFSYGSYFTFKDDILNPLGLFKPKNELTYSDLLGKCDIGCLSVMIDRKLLEGYQFPNSKKEDYALWLVLFKNHNVKAYCFPGVHCYYRISSKSLSSNKFKEVFRQYIVLRKFSSEKSSKIFGYLIYYILNGLKKHYIIYCSKKSLLRTVK